MQRREFLKTLASGMAAGWAFHCWPGAFSIAGEIVATPGLRIACLADAHLQDGDPGSLEARALARAVAEIKALSPAPRLVLFAGDLAHEADPMALALGQEILSELPMPVLAVRGEGDGRPPKGGAGWRVFKQGRFFHNYAGINLLGLDTVLQKTPEGPAFALGEAQYRWLDGVLSQLDPAAPLLVLSHAPLIPIFRAWGQWTADSAPLLKRLSRFENVFCLHGHVHQSNCVFTHTVAAHGKTPPPLVGGGWGEGKISPYSGPRPAGITPSPTLPPPGRGSADAAWRGMKNLSLPATSWPLPSPLTGTPETLRPGSGPRGCGWALLPHGGRTAQVRQVLWQA